MRLVAKAPLLRGGSSVHGASEIMSMGAAAGHGNPADNPEIHYQDTMKAARGFVDPALVRVLCEDAPLRLEDMVRLGVAFDRTEIGGIRVIASDWATHPRAHGAGGRTGRAFVQAVAAALEALGVPVDAPVSLVDLVRDDDGAICGLLAYDTERQRLRHYVATAVVLATGGVHGAFSQQVSTAEMTGDGQAVCFRQGAELVNLEFHQFGPALVHPYIQLFSGKLYHLHPRVTNRDGRAFLADYLPAGVSEADVFAEKVFPFTTSNVSRYLDIAMAREINAGRGGPHGGVFFSYAHVPEAELAARVPNTHRWLRERSLSMRDDPLEVGVAFQCMNGGVRMMSTDAESTIPGLYVVGEVAGGVRGPDRPGGNSLAEGQVFGHRAGAAAARQAGRTVGDPATLAATLDDLRALLGRPPEDELETVRADIRERMQRHCLVEKDGATLTDTLRALQAGRAEIEARLGATPETLVSALGLRNMALVAELIVRAVHNREETRSSHNRTDFPEPNDARYRHPFMVRRAGDGIRIEPFHYPE